MGSEFFLRWHVNETGGGQESETVGAGRQNLVCSYYRYYVKELLMDSIV